ncbi:MAG: hypothetical protein QXD77_00030 [Candidatus Aenigmatarchaeota archaeon]
MVTLFEGDKKKKTAEAAAKAAEARRAELEAVIRAGTRGIELPGKAKFEEYTAEYKQFLKEVKARPMGRYERAAALAEKILPIKANEKFGNIKANAEVGYLAVTPGGVLALTLLTFMAVFLIMVLSAMFFPSPALLLFLFVILGMSTYLVWSYPAANAKAVTMRISSDSVLAVLYMVVYMRTSPNLEAALRFAAETLTGPLSWDLKKLLWDIHVGAYPNADAALSAYANRWKGENAEFSEAVNLLRSSASVESSRRMKLFDETVNLILTGTAEKTKRYVVNLRMPVMLIHAMGVLLPVMGLVLFPIVVIFLSDTVSPGILFLGYDVILPVFLWFVISNVLLARPPTFSQPDVSLAKGVPPLGRFLLGKTLVPIWPIALALLVPLALLSYFMIGPCFAPDVAVTEQCTADTFSLVNLSLLITLALGLSIAVYGLLDSVQKLKVRSDIECIEKEFGVALFQLGSSITGGTPIELAIDKAAANLKGMKIADLFLRTSSNMKRFGYTFEQALFDPSVGAVWWYPSRLIRSIMTTVVEASKKGMFAASDAMVTIATYLKGMHAVKEEVEDVLGETIASMKFLSMFLTPLVAGVTITMAVVIIQILTQLGGQLSALTAGTADVGTSASLITLPWLKSGGIAITPVAFQMIVGLYMLEIAVLLSYFLNRIQFGDDAIGMRSVVAKTVLVAVVIYAFSWLVTFMIFGSAIRNLLVPVQLQGSG